MKKNKLKWFLLVLCLCGIVYIAIDINVNAEEGTNNNAKQTNNTNWSIKEQCKVGEQGATYDNIKYSVVSNGGDTYAVAITGAKKTKAIFPETEEERFPDATGTYFISGYKNGDMINIQLVSDGLDYINLEVDSNVSEDKRQEAINELTKQCNNQIVKTIEEIVSVQKANPNYNGHLCSTYRNYAGNDKALQAAVPICFKKHIFDYEEVSIDKIQEMIKIAENLNEIRNSMKENNIDLVGSVNSKEVQKAPSCDPKAESNTVEYSDVTEETVNNYCRSQCKETITVDYGPPIATYAGGGIEYEVKVTSKVECNTKITANLPKRPEVCVPQAKCYGGNWHDAGTDKAGPSEEFDSCINTCDGGKYTQSCINKCYQSVYKRNPSLVRMTDTKIKHEFINGLQEYNERQKNTRGYYYKDTKNNTFWHSNNADLSYKNLGYYYFSNPTVARLTEARLAGYKEVNSYNQNVNPFKNGYYKSDASGFLRWVSTNGNDCNATCTWTSCPDGTVLTETQATSQYDKAVEAYEEAIKECKAIMPTETKTTTYKITVENPDNVKSAFSSENLTTIIKSEETNDSSIKKETYTFPTAYINKVTGKVLYDEKKLKPKEQYVESGNKFYTSLLSKNTNSNWYDWKMGYASDFDTSKIKQNIFAEIRNFGLLNWKIDVSCFYALKNNDCPTSNECPDPGPDADPKYMDYIFRPISLTDVFPASKEAWNGRAPRWNWSCSATNTRNKNYKITPEALTSDIEKKGYSIYDTSNENSNLDYDIVLTRDTMQRVRSYNKTKDSYLDYDMTCSKVNGMEFCKSGLLTQLGSDVVKKRGLIGCNNQASGTTCDTSYSANSCMTYFKNQINSYDIINNTKIAKGE